MNYRHEFHAGNFADVLKHAALTRALLYLRRKDKPFRIIDTHAGAGLYDLTGPEAARSGEARDGIVRLLDSGRTRIANSARRRTCSQPYLDAVRAAGAPKFYPGSPLIAQKPCCGRRTARSSANCCRRPRRACAGRWAATSASRRSRSTAMSGSRPIVPPVERRGLVLIDPPFERRDEYERMFDALTDRAAQMAGRDLHDLAAGQGAGGGGGLLPRGRRGGAGLPAHRSPGRDAGAGTAAGAHRACSWSIRLMCSKRR